MMCKILDEYNDSTRDNIMMVIISSTWELCIYFYIGYFYFRQFRQFRQLFFYLSWLLTLHLVHMFVLLYMFSIVITIFV